MKNIGKKIIIILIILSFIFVGGISIFAQNPPSDQEIAELEKQLKELEKREKEILRDVTATQAEREQIQYQVSVVRRRIEQLNVEVRQAQSRAQVLTGQIKDKESSIDVTLLEINDLQNKLSENLRAINEEDQKSIIEVFLSEKDLNSFFTNSFSLERLSNDTRNVLGEIITLKVNLEEEKVSLGRTKEETEQLARIKAAQAQEAEAIRREQQKLLEETQQKEAAQKQDLEETRKQAAEIRERIFELVGLPPDVAAPTFEEAYEIALWVESRTGTRPAFLLSILQQESALGKNVGQCYLADTSSGASVHISNGQRYSNGIHPTRDIPPFLTITRELGRDPLKTPVSCPLSYGYGGAMGPAQFIPSTWQIVRNEVRNILGNEPDPWKIRDSFMASGVLLRMNGAGPRTRQAEWNAAMRYFSGGTTNSSFFWYADQVLARADQFEREIEIMLQN